MINWRKTMGGYEANLSQIKTDMKGFKETRGSGSDILYWQYTRVGPGVHKTTYTIWNK